MYVTIRNYSGGGEFADALAAREEDVRNVITTIDGFKAYYLVRTAEGVSTVSVFANQEGAQESTSAAAAWIGENIPDISPGPPQVNSGEVALSF
jgi:heme-degrading monooxygenase HmoA